MGINIYIHIVSIFVMKWGKILSAAHFFYQTLDVPVLVLKLVLYLNTILYVYSFSETDLKTLS